MKAGIVMEVIKVMKIFALNFFYLIVKILHLCEYLLNELCSNYKHLRKS